jgi:hypothetical protein
VHTRGQGGGSAVVLRVRAGQCVTREGAGEGEREDEKAHDAASHTEEVVEVKAQNCRAAPGLCRLGSGYCVHRTMEVCWHCKEGTRWQCTAPKFHFPEPDNQQTGSKAKLATFAFLEVLMTQLLDTHTVAFAHKQCLHCGTWHCS